MCWIARILVHKIRRQSGVRFLIGPAHIRAKNGYTTKRDPVGGTNGVQLRGPVTEGGGGVSIHIS